MPAVGWNTLAGGDELGANSGPVMSRYHLAPMSQWCHWLSLLAHPAVELHHYYHMVSLCQSLQPLLDLDT